MKQIDVFVDSVYQNVGGNKKEIQELKAEMKNHLLEAAHELKAEGKTEREAIDIAIERFGGEKEMRSIVGQLFKAQKIFAKGVLFTALAFLVIGSVIFGIMIAIGETNVEKDQKVAFSLLERLGESEVLSEDIKNEINSIVMQNERIQQIEIYDLQDNEPNVFRTEPDYIYERDVWVPEVEMSGFDNRDGNVQTHKWYVGIETRIYDSLAVNIFLVGMVTYWVLFSVWAIVNAYHRKRLNFGWIVSFALFNVVGYLVYRFAERKV